VVGDTDGAIQDIPAPVSVLGAAVLFRRIASRYPIAALGIVAAAKIAMFVPRAKLAPDKAMFCMCLLGDDLIVGHSVDSQPSNQITDL
jgi:hypothetical protein